MGFSGIFPATEKGLDPDVLTQLTTFVEVIIDAGRNHQEKNTVPP